MAARAAIIREQLENPESLKTLIINELKEDAKKFGDDRRAPIVEREEAVQIKEHDLIPEKP